MNWFLEVLDREKGSRSWETETYRAPEVVDGAEEEEAVMPFGLGVEELALESAGERAQKIVVACGDAACLYVLEDLLREHGGARIVGAVKKSLLGRSVGEAPSPSFRGAPVVVAGENGILYVLAGGKVDDVCARVWSRTVAESLAFGPETDVTVLASTAEILFRGEKDSLFALYGEDFKGEKCIAELETPNMIDGMAAAVFIECAKRHTPSVMFITLVPTYQLSASHVFAFNKANIFSNPCPETDQESFLAKISWNRCTTLYA